MHFARRILSLTFAILLSIYVLIILYNAQNRLNIDLFSVGISFIGIYLLIKSVAYNSESGFLLGGILFLSSIINIFGKNPYGIISYCVIFVIISGLTNVCFESKLVKFIFYCSIVSTIIVFPVYFLI